MDYILPSQITVANYDHAPIVHREPLQRLETSLSASNLRRVLSHPKTLNAWADFCAVQFFQFVSGTLDPPMPSAIEELLQKIRDINTRGPVKVDGKGSGRYGDALEFELGISKNSSKNPDFKGIEIKSKASAKLQTLFSRTPSRYTGCKSSLHLLETHGYNKGGRLQLYTSMSSKGDSMGFSIQLESEYISVVRNGEEVMQYDNHRLQEALSKKHSESAFVSVRVCSDPSFCTFDSLLYCKSPSFPKPPKLIRDGDVFLDLTLALKENGKAKDHGFLWRVPESKVPQIFSESKVFSLQ